MQSLDSNKNISILGILTAFTIIIGFLENLIPLPLPGVKLGLANIGIMLSIYILGFSKSIYIAFLKSIILSIFTGNLIIKFSISLPATVVATTIMFISYKLLKKATPLSIGAIGGFIHMNMQFFVIKTLYLKTTAIIYLVPYYSIISVFSGIVTGYITYKILKVLEQTILSS
ncbi:MAG: Gx transporter family protein [Deferribacterota bacterium]|nr:Gx transporter family protein [Deferribacterota bacterium]